MIACQWILLKQRWFTANTRTLEKQQRIKFYKENWKEPIQSPDVCK